MSTHLDIIKEILAEEDVEGYIEMGAPGDEYDSEAAELYAVISNSNDIADEDAFMKVLVSIWYKYFNLGEDEMELRLPYLRVVAQRLLSVSGTEQ